MDSAEKETAIERRRIQNRLAQRRFRQRHAQQKVSKQQGQQRQKGQANNAQPELVLPHDPDTSPDSDGWEVPTPATRIGWCHLGYGGSPMLEGITALDLDSNARTATADMVFINTTGDPTAPMPASSAKPPAEHSSSTFQRPVPSSTRDNARHGNNSGSAGPKPNSVAPGKKWQNPLHMAAQKGHNGIVCLLLEKDVDCNEGDSEGLTPLMHATIGGFQDAASSLLARGARVGATDSQNRTALHWAVVHRREALLRLLLEHCAGGDERGVVDGYDADGKTPLHAAIEAGFEAGVQVLLEFGADVKSRAGVS